MSWSAQRSSHRIQQHLHSMEPIQISNLTKEMDLEAISSEVQCKRIFGAHIYASAPRFAQLATSYYDEESSKNLLVAFHLYQQEVFRIVEQIFQGYQVHFQGPKLHAILYQPFDNNQEIAIRAVLLQLALDDFVQTVFRAVFPRLRVRGLTSGADFGETIATSNGLKNDREMLFVGSAANYAAKIITCEERIIHITRELYHYLPPGRIKELCVPVVSNVPGAHVYQVQIPQRAVLLELLGEQGISWKLEDRKRFLQTEKDRFSCDPPILREEYPLKDIKELSIRNNRRVMAASLFADVSGFTRYVKSVEKNPKELRNALRIFHIIREEMTQVVRQDFPGVHIQFQGDRIQALFAGDEQTAAQNAVHAALALQASMEKTILVLLPKASELHLAIGIDFGVTLVSKLGIRKYRDPICLGMATERAAQFEDACEKKQIAISRRIYKALSPTLSSLFQWNEKIHCYIANEVTIECVR